MGYLSFLYRYLILNKQGQAAQEKNLHKHITKQKTLVMRAIRYIAYLQSHQYILLFLARGCWDVSNQLPEVQPKANITIILEANMNTSDPEQVERHKMMFPGFNYEDKVCMTCSFVFSCSNKQNRRIFGVNSVSLPALTSCSFIDRIY